MRAGALPLNRRTLTPLLSTKIHGESYGRREALCQRQNPVRFGVYALNIRLFSALWLAARMDSKGVGKTVVRLETFRLEPSLSRDKTQP